MTVKGWYESVQEYFVVDFLDDPIFTLTAEDADKKEVWGMIDYGVCAVTLDSGHVRFHRVGIPVSRLGEPNKVNLAGRLAQAARTLKNMENEFLSHSSIPNPDSLTLRQLRSASEMLKLHHESIIEACMMSYRSAQGVS